MLLSADTAAFFDKASLLGILMLGGFAFGSLPAFVAGLVMAGVTWRRGSLGYHHAALAGAAGALLLAAAVAVNAQRGAAEPDSTAGVMMIFPPISITAALVCRFLMARIRLLPSSRSPSPRR